ncbi:MAG TPA: DUF411 domain-containing protein [Sedimenticola sp.]|nr:DUF411 domain-containing protein [Sedimenticola sp.]
MLAEKGKIRIWSSFAVALSIAGGAALWYQSAPEAAEAEITMYKSATCGCCKHWATHLRKAGFSVAALNRKDMNAIKAEYGVKSRLRSCHTAIVDGYVIEGHVPAADIRRLLREKPPILGLTAPGMPKKSPGMQPEGLPPKGYRVLSFDARGATSVFTQY